MKSLRVFKKNLLLLIRSKGSAAVVLFAPLIIILIIGISFTDTTDTRLPIGVHSPENTELSQRYIDALNSSRNEVTLYDSAQACISAIRDGFVVTCIAFPTDFRIEDNRRNEITFYVDESRLSLVYQLVASISVNIDEASTEVSRELTNRLLGVLAVAADEVGESSKELVALKARTQIVERDISQSRSTLDNIDATTETINIGGAASDIGAIRNRIINLRADAKDAIDAGRVVTDNQTASEYVALDSALNSLETRLVNTNTTSADLNAIMDLLEEAETSAARIAIRMQETAQAKTQISSTFEELGTRINLIQQDIDKVRERQDRVLSAVDSFELTQAESIISPISTSIQPVAARNSRVTYSFPYLLMLVVLFVGIMLSSTMVFIEKDSKAFFRNFTTPTKTIFLTNLTYITSMFVILMQIIIILAAAHFALGIPVFNNFEVTAILLVLSSTIFVLLGMLIGTALNTGESITMTSITLSSIFIFLSNLILPIETFSEVAQHVLAYNPYVLASESVRKSMLLQSDYAALTNEIITMVLYCIILFMFILMTQQFMKMKYFSGGLLKKKVITVPEDHYLQIPEHDVKVKDISDLVKTLREMSDETYKELTAKNNVFSEWLRNDLKEKRLAAKIKRKTREKAVKILEARGKKMLKKKIKENKKLE